MTERRQKMINGITRWLEVKSYAVAEWNIQMEVHLTNYGAVVDVFCNYDGAINWLRRNKNTLKENTEGKPENSLKGKLTK